MTTGTDLVRRRMLLSPIGLAFAYIGFEAAYPKATYEIGPVALSLLAALALAALGWRSPIRSPSMRLYLVGAVAFSLWTFVSAVAAWNTTTMYSATTLFVWLVFLVPGLASELRHRERLQALVFGLAIGAVVFISVGTARIVRGADVLDVVDGEATGVLLGVNRNRVNMIVIALMPFLLARLAPVLIDRLRWLIVGLGALFVVNSGGRSGLLGLCVGVLAFVVLQPSATRRFQQVVVALLIAIVAFSWMQASGGEATKSTVRLTEYFSGVRGDDDEARGLLVRKAWHLAVESPAFGVGLGNFGGTYHPVVEDASNPRVRDLAISLDEHNTYAKVVSEMGFPGLAAFLYMLVTLIAAGRRFAHDRASRAATAALIFIAFYAYFHDIIGTSIYVPVAILLGALAGLHDPVDDEVSTPFGPRP